jgi:hypothetical protein
MDERELDIDPVHLLAWLRAEGAAAERTLSVRATRDYFARDVPHPELLRIGEETELAELCAVGVLDIRPADASDGWSLEVRVEDELGPHTPDDESVDGEAEQIDLDAFEADFIAPRRGTVFVAARFESEAARLRFEALFADLLSDRHDS